MIYLMEDDTNIRKFVLYALKNVGMEARGFETPSEFRAAMKEQHPSLLLLDIMLPEEDGLSILRSLRQDPGTKDLPIIMLTAKATEYDKVVVLDDGADDYISKPFGTMELISRIRALLRRSGGSAEKEDYTVGDLYVSPGKHVAQVCGRDVALSYK